MKGGGQGRPPHQLLKPVGRASVPAMVISGIGGTGFQPVRRTGWIAGATKNFSEQSLMGRRPTRKL